MLLSKDRLNNSIYLILLTTSIYSQSCRADSHEIISSIYQSLPSFVTPESLESIKPKVIEITEGISMYSGNNSETISLTPVITNKYKEDRTHNHFANWELFLATHKNINKSTLYEYGLALDTIGGLTIKGDVWQDALPVFDNYNYSFRVNHHGLSIKNKFLFDIEHSFKPFIHINLGLALNTAYANEIIAKGPGIIAGLPFKSGSNISFMYKLGAGVQTPIGQDGYQIGIGYEFANLGKSKLGKTPLQTINSGISLDHIYTHSLQLVLSFPT